VEKARGRPLLHASADLSPGNASVWIETTDVDLIVYSNAVVAAKRLRPLAHQMAHILLRHQPIASGTSLSLFGHLNPALAASVPTVGCYTPADERAAEDFASPKPRASGMPS
jgi:hypothetical protein